MSDKPEISLSKTDLYFLALVSAGAAKLEPVVPEHESEDGINLYYVPELRKLTKNIKNLRELYYHVKGLVNQIGNGEDPCKSFDT